MLSACTAWHRLVLDVGPTRACMPGPICADRSCPWSYVTSILSWIYDITFCNTLTLCSSSPSPQLDYADAIKNTRSKSMNAPELNKTLANHNRVRFTCRDELFVERLDLSQCKAPTPYFHDSHIDISRRL